MKNYFQKTKEYIQSHKKMSIAIAILLLIACYYIYKSATSTAGDTTYSFGTVEKGTIVSSITGSGQVSANRQLDLKPLASGNVVYVGVQEGQTVTQGQLLVELDATTAQKSVRDAQANLDSAQIALKKTQQPADTLTLLQAQNALTQSQADLTKAYNDGYNTISSTFLDIPSIITGLDSLLHNSDASGVSNGQQNINFYADAASQYEQNASTSGKAAALSAVAEKKFTDAKAAYDINFTDFKNLSRTSDTTTVQSVINETYTTTSLIADATQSLQNLIQYYQDTTTTAGRTPIAKSNTHLTTLSGYIGKINSDVAALAAIKSTITSALASVPEKQASLDKTKTGADSLDLESAQLSVTKAQNGLQDAKDTLANYYVRAPFGGTVAKLNVKTGDPANSNTAVATLIANEQVVDIPLNEVDVAKVKVGEKATLTFDAIDSLTLTGKVASIDTIGTVTSGVVNYTVTIAFDTTDPRVKPGMSTTASIITQVEQDVLTVPSSAVKNSPNGSYVLAFTTGSVDTSSTTSLTTATIPQQIPVTTGISDDTNTEILSGLTEGQQIITRSIIQSATTATSAPSLLSGVGGNRSTTGAARTGGTTRAGN